MSQYGAWSGRKIYRPSVINQFQLKILEECRKYKQNFLQPDQMQISMLLDDLDRLGSLAFLVTEQDNKIINKLSSKLGDARQGKLTGASYQTDNKTSRYDKDKDFDKPLNFRTRETNTQKIIKDRRSIAADQGEEE